MRSARACVIMLYARRARRMLAVTAIKIAKRRCIAARRVAAQTSTKQVTYKRRTLRGASGAYQHRAARARRVQRDIVARCCLYAP